MEHFSLDDLLEVREDYTNWENTQYLPDECLLKKLGEQRYGKEANPVQFISIAFIASKELVNRLLEDKRLTQESKDAEYDC